MPDRVTEHKKTRTSCFGMLTADASTPDVPQASVRPDLLQTFQVVTEFGINAIRQDLRVFSIDYILLPVQEPERDLELCGVLHDVHDPFQLIRI